MGRSALVPNFESGHSVRFAHHMTCLLSLEEISPNHKAEELRHITNPRTRTLIPHPITSLRKGTMQIFRITSHHNDMQIYHKSSPLTSLTSFMIGRQERDSRHHIVSLCGYITFVQHSASTSRVSNASSFSNLRHTPLVWKLVVILYPDVLSNWPIDVASTNCVLSTSLVSGTHHSFQFETNFPQPDYPDQC
jgi:hypothetical protein